MEEFVEQPIKVYVMVNENNEITAINSEIFIRDLTDWVYVDEGFGDKYAHAQSNYFGEELSDDDGNYKFVLDNGKIVRK